MENTASVKSKIKIKLILTPGIFPPGTVFINVYIFSPPELEESAKAV